MKFPDRKQFLPSKSILTTYLGTKKDDLSVSGNTFKPLLSDSGAPGLFWIAAIIELVGLILTIYGGARRSTQYLLIAVVVVVLLIIIDFVVGVLVLHRNSIRNTYIDAVTSEVENDAGLLLIKNNTKDKIIDWLFSILLIVIALFKSIALWFLHPFTGITIYIPIAILFLVASIIHMKYTGYYLYHWWVQKKIKKEYNNSVTDTTSNADTQNATGNQYFYTPTELNDLPIKVGFHRIEKNPKKEDKEGKYNYVLKINKLITDDEAQDLCNGQSPTNSLIIFRICRSYQLDNLINKPKSVKINVVRKEIEYLK